MWDTSRRSIDDNFYRRPAWKKCRSAYIAFRQGRDGGLCEICGKKPGKIVHHKCHLTQETVNDPDIAYGFDNLELVCLDCHNEEHGYIKKPKVITTKYVFDANGHPVPVPDSPPSMKSELRS